MPNRTGIRARSRPPPPTRRIAGMASLRERLSPRTRTGPARATGRNLELGPRREAGDDPGGDRAGPRLRRQCELDRPPRADGPGQRGRAVRKRPRAAHAECTRGDRERADGGRERLARSEPACEPPERLHAEESEDRPPRDEDVEVSTERPEQETVDEGGKRTVGITDIAIEQLRLRRGAAPCSSRVPSPRTAESSA